jgi:signal transduction histidine kinase
MVKFIITALEASLFIAAAAVVYLARRNNFINRYFSLFLLFISMWLFSGFIDRVISEPSTYLVTMQYRFAYAAATMATGFFFLFALGFYLGRGANKLLVRSVCFVSLVMFFICFTDMIIARAEYLNRSYLVTKGPFYFGFILFFTLLGGGGLFYVTLKWRHSRSIDRARALYILIGFGIFFLLAFVLTIVMPSFMTRDVTSDYTFLAVIIPAGFTAYAILRYQLLDVRLALRRSFAYILTLAFFGIPVVILYATLRSFWASHPATEKAVSVIILALAIALTPVARNFTEKIATRFLFTGLYNDIELLHRVSSIHTSTANIREGIGSTTTLTCRELRLQKLIVVIPREIISGKGDWVVGSRKDETGITDFNEVNLTASPLYRLRQSPLVKDDIVSGFPAVESDIDLIREMKEKGLVACIPIRGTLGEVGVLLVGEKAGRAALDPMDLSFLSQFAERSGIYIENHLLSTYLMAQLEEARQVQRKVEELDRFKTDIINVTSHEFRTPLTVLNGYAYMLLTNYEDFGKGEREEYLQYIIDSCGRLSSILNQFITISHFQKGEVQISRQTMPLKELFDDVQASLSQEQNSRIFSELKPADLMVSADRSYLAILLKNLVDNAIRFSPPESPVIIKAEMEDEGVRISVRDFGKGINPSEIRNIFNPFDTLEDANKHQIGTGLGLYIVRLIADLLDTEIDVNSQPGKGTEFSFRLPFFPVSPISPETQA